MNFKGLDLLGFPTYMIKYPVLIFRSSVSFGLSASIYKCFCKLSDVSCEKSPITSLLPPEFINIVCRKISELAGNLNSCYRVCTLYKELQIIIRKCLNVETVSTFSQLKVETVSTFSKLKVETVSTVSRLKVETVSTFNHLKVKTLVISFAP